VFLWRFRSEFLDLDLKRAVILVGLIIAMLCWPVRNMFVWGNPTHPFRPPLVSTFFDVKWDKTLEHDAANSPIIFSQTTAPVRFIISVFEVNRLWDSWDSFRWTYDQGNQNGPRSPHHRMGGFSFLIAMLVFWLVIYWKLYLHREAQVMLFAMALISAMPQSHELRYWLAMPMIWALIIVSRQEFLRGVGVKGLLVVILCYTLYSIKDNAFFIDLRQPSQFAPSYAREFWNEASSDKVYSICNRIPYGLFWSGPTFREYMVKDCY
jgi:hypothetical protein